MAFELSIRINEENPGHHLWLNHGAYWVHYCITDGGRRRRVRFSLETSDFQLACQKRDELFLNLAQKSAGGAQPQAAPGAGLEPGAPQVLALRPDAQPAAQPADEAKQPKRAAAQSRAQSHPQPSRDDKRGAHKRGEGQAARKPGSPDHGLQPGPDGPSGLAA